MLMEMSMMGSGRKTRHAATALISTTTELNMKENGSKIISTDMEYKNGLMVVVMKACIKKVKNMVKENIAGEMVVIITDIGHRIR